MLVDFYQSLLIDKKSIGNELERIQKSWGNQRKCSLNTCLLSLEQKSTMSI